MQVLSARSTIVVMKCREASVIYEVTNDKIGHVIRFIARFYWRLKLRPQKVGRFYRSYDMGFTKKNIMTYCLGHPACACLIGIAASIDTWLSSCVGITLLLSMTVFQLIIADKVPESSQAIPLVGTTITLIIRTIALA